MNSKNIKIALNFWKQDETENHNNANSSRILNLIFEPKLDLKFFPLLKMLLAPENSSSRQNWIFTIKQFARPGKASSNALRWTYLSILFLNRHLFENGKLRKSFRARRLTTDGFWCFFFLAHFICVVGTAAFNRNLLSIELKYCHHAWWRIQSKTKAYIRRFSKFKRRPVDSPTTQKTQKKRKEKKL